MGRPVEGGRRSSQPHAGGQRPVVAAVEDVVVVVVDGSCMGRLRQMVAVCSGNWTSTMSSPPPLLLLLPPGENKEIRSANKLGPTILDADAV